MTDQNPELAQKVQLIFNEIVFASRKADAERVVVAWNSLAELFGLKDRGTNIGLARIVGIPHDQMARHRLGKIFPRPDKLFTFAKNLTLKVGSNIQVPEENEQPSPIFKQSSLQLLLNMVNDWEPKDSVRVEKQGSEIVINPSIAKGIISESFNRMLLMAQNHGMVNMTVSRAEDRKSIVITPIEPK